MVTKKAYKRIISLAPSITETLFAIGYGSKLVGRTEFCTWPEEVSSVPVIGGFKSIDVKLIFDQAPDIVLGTSLHENILAQVRVAGIGIAAICAYPAYAAPTAIREIGHAVGAVNESNMVAKETEARITKIKHTAESLTPLRVCYFCNISCSAWYSCQIAASVEFLNCTLAGRALPQARDRDEIIDRIIADSPDLFIIPECRRCRGNCITPLLTTNDKLMEYMAARNPRIVDIKPDLLARAAPRADQGLDELGLLIFGNLWKMQDA